MPSLPNFILIGAPKCGTTSLYRYLDQHPQIFMSRVKEPTFFACSSDEAPYVGYKAEHLLKGVINDVNAYRHLFDSTKGAMVLGEASPAYLASPIAAKMIKEFVPEAKLAVMLRNPAERAFSAFLHLRRDGFEPESDFGRALDLEEERAEAGWRGPWLYRRNGYYYRHLRRYYDLFGKEQISIFFQEDMRSCPEAFFSRVFRFLGVDQDFVPHESVRYQVSGASRYPKLHRFFAGPTRANKLLKALLPPGVRMTIRAKTLDRLLTPVAMNPDVRTDLLTSYREDILKLSRLIDRDLSGWQT